MGEDNVIVSVFIHTLSVFVPDVRPKVKLYHLLYTKQVDAIIHILHTRMGKFCSLIDI